MSALEAALQEMQVDANKPDVVAEVPTETPTTVDGFNALRKTLSGLASEIQHAQPFVLENDACGRDSCLRPRERMLPCLDCCGAKKYCCLSCSAEDYVVHTYTCSDTLRTLSEMTPCVATLREQQMDDKHGFQNVVSGVLRAVAKEKLLSSYFLIPMPISPRDRFKKNHPVKMVPRVGAIKMFSQNICLVSVYEKILKKEMALLQAEGEVDQQLYFVVYPPDFAYCLLIMVPYEEEQRFDESQKPETVLVPCTCNLHLQPVS